MRAAFNPNQNLTIKSNVSGAPHMSEAFGARDSFTPDAATATAVLAAAALKAGLQYIVSYLHSPATARVITITGTVGGATALTGNVVITGTDTSDDPQTETIALAGVATVSGEKLFKTVTGVHFPVRANSSGDAVSVGDSSGTATILIATALGAAAFDMLAGEITNPSESTGAEFPPGARNVTAKGNASGITGDVVVTGLDRAGGVITDTIHLSGDGEVAGVLCFATVTKIALPVQTHSGTDTVSIGVGALIGLGAIPLYECLVKAVFDGDLETGSNVTIGSTISETNYEPDGSPDGNAVLDLFYALPWK